MQRSVCWLLLPVIFCCLPTTCLLTSALHGPLPVICPLKPAVCMLLPVIFFLSSACGRMRVDCSCLPFAGMSAVAFLCHLPTDVSLSCASACHLIPSSVCRHLLVGHGHLPHGHVTSVYRHQPFVCVCLSSFSFICMLKSACQTRTSASWACQPLSTDTSHSCASACHLFPIICMSTSACQTRTSASWACQFVDICPLTPAFCALAWASPAPQLQMGSVHFLTRADGKACSLELQPNMQGTPHMLDWAHAVGGAHASSCELIQLDMYCSVVLLLTPAGTRLSSSSVRARSLSPLPR
eukprot:1161464-Pelagomonas_calceolata.AAC.3